MVEFNFRSTVYSSLPLPASTPSPEGDTDNVCHFLSNICLLNDYFSGMCCVYVSHSGFTVMVIPLTLLDYS